MLFSPFHLILQHAQGSEKGLDAWRRALYPVPMATHERREWKRLPTHGPCLVCGSENPRGFGLTWYLRPDGVVTAVHTFTIHQQGPPSFAHGGATAAVLDEAMGAAVWIQGYRVVAVHLEVEYRRPVPLGVEVTVEGWVVEGEEERILRAEGRILLPDGRVAVMSRGLYAEAPQYFQELGEFSWRPS